jgi:hypothetical protein
MAQDLKEVLFIVLKDSRRKVILEKPVAIRSQFSGFLEPI